LLSPDVSALRSFRAEIVLIVIIDTIVIIDIIDGIEG